MLHYIIYNSIKLGAISYCDFFAYLNLVLKNIAIFMSSTNTLIYIAHVVIYVFSITRKKIDDDHHFVFNCTEILLDV